MAALTIVTPARAANSFTFAAAAAGGDTFLNTGKELVIIRNGSGSSMTVTIVTTKTVDGEAVDDKDIVIPAGEDHLLGPFPGSIYDDGSNLVSLTYSLETSVTLAVIKPA